MGNIILANKKSKWIFISRIWENIRKRLSSVFVIIENKFAEKRISKIKERLYLSDSSVNPMSSEEVEFRKAYNIPYSFSIESLNKVLNVLSDIQKFSCDKNEFYESSWNQNTMKVLKQPLSKEGERVIAWLETSSIIFIKEVKVDKEIIPSRVFSINKKNQHRIHMMKKECDLVIVVNNDVKKELGKDSDYYNPEEELKKFENILSLENVRTNLENGLTSDAVVSKMSGASQRQ
jgi:hypothetical protein